MRQIKASQVIETVKNLCMEANFSLGHDIMEAYQIYQETEQSPVGKELLGKLYENACLAKDKQMPICQDTGMAVIFVEIGQEVSMIDQSWDEAICEGVRQGYREGYLRASVVSDPLNRVNTKDNTPAIIHYQMVSGDKVDITVAPKGFGSENMSGVKMLKPSDGVEGVKQFVLSVVDQAGSNPCPPMVVGVGIGGTMEKAAFLSKKALLRPVGQLQENPYYADLEKELLTLVNQTGIGPQGLGGTTTAFSVNIETFPTHIAGLPVAVNISCHVTRHAHALI